MVINRNWKTRWCEIDIVAGKGGVLYFVEVKYRSGSGQGGGIAALTSTKHKQMYFAAEYYMAKHGAFIKNYHEQRLAVIVVSPRAVEPPLLID